MKRLLALSWFLLYVPSCSHIQNEVPCWSVHEIMLTATREQANPYTQAGVTSVFTGPGRITKEVSGFWDGDSTFRIRFTPTALGKWSWMTTSADPGLDRRSGVINCTAPDAGRHGFLRRDQSNPYSFVWDDGSRYFMWGQTYYDVMLNVMARGGWKAGVDNTAAHGMNKIRLHVFAHKNYKAGVEDMTYSQVVPFGGAFSNLNRDQLNIAYWQGLDEYVRYVESKGLVADLILFNPYGENVMWGTQDQDERYLRYILARYAAFPHVIWCVCNEWNYATKPRSYFDRMGAIIRNEDPWVKEGANLRALSIHQGTRIDFSYFDADWPVHAIIQYGVRNNVQNSRPETTKDPVTRFHIGDEWGNASIVYNLGHDMPVVNDEYGYIGEKAPVELTQTQHRQAMWGIAAAGGFGAVGDFRRPPTGNPEITGDWLDAPEYDDIQHMVSFFETKGLEYWKMVSHNELKLAGSRVYVLAEPGRQYLFYAAVGGSFSVRIDPGTYTARRYNPRTGEDTFIADQRAGDAVSFTLPDTSDWVVYLRIKQ